MVNNQDLRSSFGYIEDIASAGVEQTATETRTGAMETIN